MMSWLKRLLGVKVVLKDSMMKTGFPEKLKREEEGLVMIESKMCSFIGNGTRRYMFQHPLPCVPDRVEIYTVTGHRKILVYEGEASVFDSTGNTMKFSGKYNKHNQKYLLVLYPPKKLLPKQASDQ